MPEAEIHLKVSLPSDNLDVNQIVILVQEAVEQIGPLLMSWYLEASQNRMLDEVLGGKWGHANQAEASWACPECHSQKGFKRRGSRSRVLRKSSLGRVSFKLRQVTCSHCGKTFSPFLPRLGMRRYQVSTTEFQAKAVRVACQTSYARCASHLSELAHVQVSATAVHAWIQAKGEQVVFDVEQADGQPVLLDSTKVRATDKKTGCSLNLGVSVQGRCWRNGRTQLKVYPVCFGVNEPWVETARSLARVKPARILFDRHDAFVDWLNDTFPDVPKQRCRWHLVTQLYRALWRDGLRKTQADVWMGKLGKIMYHPDCPVQHSRHDLMALIAELRQQNLTHGAYYLAAAEPYAFTYREHPDGMFFDERTAEPHAISSTSPIERQIREINRRTDIGARWSVPGVRNLVSLDLARRFDPGQWSTLWGLPQKAPSNFVAGKLRIMRVGMQPTANVKTT